MDKIKIISIERIDEDVDVYDIEVEDDHTFLVEGVFVHNCPVCGALDGTVYYYGRGQEAPSAPRHPNCRCTLAPITKTWKELGLNRADIPDEERASFEGPIPAKIDYETWLKSMNVRDPAFVQDILGPRYAMWNEGRLTLKEMVTDSRVLTLEELEGLAGSQGLGLKVADSADIFIHPQWALADQINGITMGDFVTLVKKGKWEKVAGHLDDVMAKQPLAVVQHNLNELNMMRYLQKEDWKTLASEYSKIARPRLYPNTIEPIQPLPAEIQAKMSARQIAASKNVWRIDKQTRTIADDMEKKIAKAIGGEHNIANTPFDVFLDNEFIEVKTQLQNYSKGYKYQIQVHTKSKPKKFAFEKRYGVRGHLIAVDMTPGSQTFGKVFYSPEIKKWTLGNMKELGHIDDGDIGQKIITEVKRGAKPVKAPDYARVKTPKVNTLKTAENWAKKNIGVKTIDFDGIDPEVADLFNQYTKGAVDALKVKPKAIRFDPSYFTGRNGDLAGLSFEDGTIIFNPNYYKSVQQLKKLAKQQYDLAINWFTTDSKGHIFRHELSHQRYFKLGGTEKTAARRIDVKELKKAIGKTDLPRFVSKYGLSNEGEFYAEQLARKLDGQKLHPVCEKFMRNIEARIAKVKK